MRTLDDLMAVIKTLRTDEADLLAKDVDDGTLSVIFSPNASNTVAEFRRIYGARAALAKQQGRRVSGADEALAILAERPEMERMNVAVFHNARTAYVVFITVGDRVIGPMRMHDEGHQ